LAAPRQGTSHGFRARRPSIAFLQELRELVDAALVTPAGKLGAKERHDTGLGHVGPDQPASEGKDVGVIMFARETGRERIVHPGAAAAGVAVAGKRSANPATAADVAPIRTAGRHPHRQARAKVRILYAFGAVGARSERLVAGFAGPGD